jgi:hypothetical protein
MLDSRQAREGSSQGTQERGEQAGEQNEPQEEAKTSGGEAVLFRAQISLTSLPGYLQSSHRRRGWAFWAK